MSFETLPNDCILRIYWTSIKELKCVLIYFQFLLEILIAGRDEVQLLLLRLNPHWKVWLGLKTLQQVVIQRVRSHNTTNFHNSH